MRFGFGEELTEGVKKESIDIDKVDIVIEELIETEIGSGRD